MSITRLALEAELNDRVGGLLALVKDPSAVVPSGGTAAYTGAIAFAASRFAGLVPATAGVITDDDLSIVPDASFYPLCDLAEYRLIRNVLNNYAEPNQQDSYGRQDLDDMMKRFAATADALEKQYAAYLNIRRAPAVVGEIRSHFPVPGHRHWGLGHGRMDH